MSVETARKLVRELATAGNLGEDLDRALDVLALEVQSAQPCYVDGRAIACKCSSCQARAKLAEMKVEV